MRISTVAGSVAINAALLGLLALLAHPRPAPPVHEDVAVEVIDVPPASAPIDDDDGGGGSTGLALPEAAPAPISPRPAIRPAVTPPASPWSEVDVHVESNADNNGNDNAVGNEVGDGIGNGIGNRVGDGNGHGDGIGNGHGLGRGLASGDMRAIAELRAPKPSYARPAKLLHPTRETAVEDAELFVAVVTVDTDGDVVGARMTQSHPGSRGDTASSMIWQFRYSPALDDDGKPTRSTFEQKFAVR